MKITECRVCFLETPPGLVKWEVHTPPPFIALATPPSHSWVHNTTVHPVFNNYCNPPPVPEPSTAILLVLGFVAVILYKEINARIFSRRN